MLPIGVVFLNYQNEPRRPKQESILPRKIMKHIEISFDQSMIEHPQAYNCMSYFYKLILSDLPELIKGKVWISGGIVRNWMLGEYLNTDIDFFSSDKSKLATLVYHLRNKYGFKPYLISKNAIKGTIKLKGKEVKVDIVKRLFENQQETIENFDFTVCCFSTNGETFVYNESAPFDLLRKRLVVNSLPYPVDTLKRLQRYIKKGYTACNGTLMTLAIEITKVDPNNTDLFDFYKFD